MDENKLSVQELLLWIFAVIPLIVFMCIYRILPDRCIIGIWVVEVCYYGARNILWLFSIVPVVFATGITVYLGTGERKNKSCVYTKRIALAVIVFMLGYMIAVFLRNFDVEIIEVYNLVCFSMSILFATVGSALIKDKTGTVLDIKNKWTTEDVRVLDKTNKLAGNMCIIGGFIQALSAILLGRQRLVVLMLIVFLACIIVPNVMSFVWYKKYNK